MAALPDTRARSGAVLLAGGLAAAFLATRIALTWRFPWFVDETTFASFARDVHGDVASWLFIAESDHKGLLPSWLGAGLISAGIAPVTAMRLLAVAGTALAATCGGLLMRRLYGRREGFLTAALIALGPYFLVTASVGIYDAMATGLVAAAVLASIRLARNPTLYPALALGCILGAGGLTKPTTWAAAIVLPFTLLLFDYRSPEVRRRLAVVVRARGDRTGAGVRVRVDGAPHPALQPAAQHREPAHARRVARATSAPCCGRTGRRSGTLSAATSRSRGSSWHVSAWSSPRAGTAPPQ